MQFITDRVCDMRLLSLTAVAAGLLTLSGCTDRPAADSAAESVEAVASPTAAQAVGAPVPAADLPRWRPGVWRTNTTTGNGERNIITQCVGPEQALLDNLPEAGDASACTDTYTRLAGGIRMLRRCSQNGMETTMQGDIIGDFQTRATMNVEMRLTIPGQPAPMTRRIQATREYVGPCAAGQEPGLIDDGE